MTSRQHPPVISTEAPDAIRGEAEKSVRRDVLDRGTARDSRSTTRASGPLRSIWRRGKRRAIHKPWRIMTFH